MRLRELIERIGQAYDRTLPMNSEAQVLLRGAGGELAKWLPAGYTAEGSGGKGNPAICPWIAVFDPDETSTARHGMYVVYLFAADMSTVALSLNQGVTEIGEKLGRPRARAALRAEAAEIRARFLPDAIDDLLSTLSLGSNADLPTDYEHGNIVVRTYDLAALPEEDAMVEDLQRFVRLYARALEARAEGRQRGDLAIVSTTYVPRTLKDGAEFKPKDEVDYRQMIESREIVKSRKHEVREPVRGLPSESGVQREVSAPARHHRRSGWRALAL